MFTVVLKTVFLLFWDTHYALGYEAMKSRSRPEPLRVILAERRNQNRALSLPGREVEDEGS